MSILEENKTAVGGSSIIMKTKRGSLQNSVNLKYHDTSGWGEVKRSSEALDP